MSSLAFQAQSFQLAGSGASLGNTSVTLSSFNDIDGNAILMASLGTIAYGTLEPSSGLQEESIQFTGITSNANGTVTLTGVSNVGFGTPYTVTSGLLKSHAGGVTFILSNSSAFESGFARKDNNETITGQWTFNTFPITPSNSDASTTVKGVSKLSVNPSTSTNPIAIGDNDIRVSAYTVDTGTANAYVIAPSPAITAYVAGERFTFKATNANSGASTINVNSLGVKTIFKNVGTALVTGDILANSIYNVVYDGTNFQILNPSASASTPTNVQAFTSSGTWTKPANSKAVYAVVIGGGGGGGNTTNGGGGGGGALLAQTTFDASLLGSTETVTVGAGGNGGATGGTNSGTAGGDSSFGTKILAKGGAAGLGSGVGGNGGLGLGGGATGTNGTVGIWGGGGGGGSSTGAAGAPGFSGFYAAGGGGGSSNTAGAGGIIPDTPVAGLAILGGGGTGAVTAVATAGSAYGGGGGGGGGGGSAAGGAGGAGFVMVITYF